MSNKDYDSWDVAERLLEVATGALTLYTIVKPNNKLSAALAGASLVGRIVCALIEPPKCPRCKRRMSKDSVNDYYICNICGLVKMLGY